MQHASSDIVSHIGTFMSVEDRRKCLETSSIFQNINSTYDGHCLKFNDGNVNERLQRLPTTLRYLYKIKPNIKEIACKFENITTCHLPTDEHGNILEHVIDDPNIVVEILALRSSESVIYDILRWFGPSVKIEITSKRMHGNEKYLQEPNLTILRTMTNGTNDIHLLMQKISHVPELHLVCSNTPAITFEYVDITRNNALYIFLYDIDVRMHDFYKVTFLHFKKQFINGYNKLYQSIRESKDQERRHPFRVEYVCIDNGICQDMIPCLKLLPVSCTFLILPHASSILWDIAQLLSFHKDIKINYICHNREEYLRVLLLQKSHHAYNLPMYKFSEYKPDDTNVYTLHDVYNAMSDLDKKEWYGVYVLAQCNVS